jgi:hydrogenase/urease accessory protein HupE
MNARLLPSLVALFALFFQTATFAHEVRPAYLELREQKPGEFSVLWKTPVLGDARLSLEPEFSGEAKAATPVTTRNPPGAAIQEWTLHASALRGQTLRIRGLDGTVTDVLVRFEFADGTTWTHRLTGKNPSAVIPMGQSVWSVAGVYVKLGVEHILTGIDHLLFILALLIITRGGWRLLKTVTAFTISHSLTLTAATLGWVHVPPPPVETVIALSIVFVAAEIVRQRRGIEGITARAPWLVAFSFGLMHGLGFAGGLSEAGLPVGHIPTALLFFSIGVEAGHFLFIGIVLSLIALGRHSVRSFGFGSRITHHASRISLIPPYAIGTVAMCWVIQRLAAF